MIPWEKFVEWAFLGLISGLFAFTVRYLSHLTKSVDQLNAKMILVLERQAQTGEVLHDHEKRLRHVEQHVVRRKS